MEWGRKGWVTCYFEDPWIYPKQNIIYLHNIQPHFYLQFYGPPYCLLAVISLAKVLNIFGVSQKWCTSYILLLHWQIHFRVGGKTIFGLGWGCVNIFYMMRGNILFSCPISLLMNGIYIYGCILVLGVPFRPVLHCHIELYHHS